MKWKMKKIVQKKIISHNLLLKDNTVLNVWNN